MKKNKLSIHLIIYISIFSVLIFISMAVLVVLFTSGNMESIVYNKTDDFMEIMEQQTEHYVSHPKNELYEFRRQLNNDSPREIIDKYFDIYEYLYRVEILNEDGEIVDSIPYIENRIGLDMSQNVVYESIKYSEDEEVLGQMMLDTYLREPTMFISMKYKDGYVVGYLNLVPFVHLLEGIEVTDGKVSIIDEQGNYISHTNHELVKQRAVDPFAKDIRNGNIKNKSEVTYLGEEVILHYQPIENTNWNIVYYQNVDAIKKPVRGAILNNLVVFLILLPVFIFLILRIIGKIEISLDKLIQATIDVSKGDYTLNEESFDYDEFNDLFKQVKLMSKKVSTREDEIVALNSEVQNNYFTTIVLLAKAIDAKDVYTGNHSARVSEYSLLLATELELSEREMLELRFGATLHDIGKLGIVESVLNKPGKLTAEEYATIKSHSQMGYDIVEELPGMQLAKQVILHHHENYDGSGYPYGLKENEIPLLARIVSIADSFDAMTSERPYRSKHMSKKEGFIELRRCSGIQFDPKLVEAFIKRVKHGGYNESIRRDA